MKITIEPSKSEQGYLAVTIDTLTNDECTTEAVAAALSAIVAYGHDKKNTAEAAIGWAEETNLLDKETT